MLGELTKKETDEVLQRNSIGRIGCTNGTEVYIVPIFYVYREGYVLCYSLEGRKIDIMRSNPTVCFEVDEIQNMYHWKCVLINGLYEEVTDEAEIAVLRPHYFEYNLRKRADSHSSSQKSLPLFFKIKTVSSSGRYQEGLI